MSDSPQLRYGYPVAGTRGFLPPGTWADGTEEGTQPTPDFMENHRGD